MIHLPSESHYWPWHDSTTSVSCCMSGFVSPSDPIHSSWHLMSEHFTKCSTFIWALMVRSVHFSNSTPISYPFYLWHHLKLSYSICLTGTATKLYQRTGPSQLLRAFENFQSRPTYASWHYRAVSDCHGRGTQKGYWQVVIRCPLIDMRYSHNISLEYNTLHIGQRIHIDRLPVEGC